jgi:hypothetical protein
MTETSEPIPGLERLRRERPPQNDLWPGIEARLKPRRNYAPWVGLAIAASLMLTVVVPLRMQTGPVPGSAAASTDAGQSQQARYFAAQLKVVYGAEAELLRALKQQPDSAGLHRLLESTRQRQRELHRLISTYA